MKTILQKQEIINKVPTSDLWDYLTEKDWNLCEVCGELVDTNFVGWDDEQDCCGDCRKETAEDNADYQNDLERDE